MSDVPPYFQCVVLLLQQHASYKWPCRNCWQGAASCLELSRIIPNSVWSLLFLYSIGTAADRSVMKGSLSMFQNPFMKLNY